jgi:hypothetical protein
VYRSTRSSYRRREQEHRQSDDADDDGDRVRARQLETVVRPRTRGDDLELLLVGEPEDEREPRDAEEAAVGGVGGAVVRVGVSPDERDEPGQTRSGSVVVRVVAVVVSVVAISAVTPRPVRVTVSVLANSQHHEQNPGDDAHGTTDRDAPGQLDRVVDLREREVPFRVEERPDHRDATDEVTDADDEARREPVEPRVRPVERVGGGDRPAVARFDAVEGPECDGPDEEAGRVTVEHP